MVNKKYFYILNTLVFWTFIIGYIFKENSAGGGPGDYNHIATNYNLIFSNNFLDINWNKYDSSRFPLHYFITKLYLPLDYNIIKLNNFILSLLIPIILFLSLQKKINNLQINHYVYLIIAQSFIIYLSPYLRTSAYWMLEENFGIFFLVISSYFLFSVLSVSNNHKLLKILTNLFFIYCAFFCSQNLFVFVIINFLFLITFFWRNKLYILFIIILNCFFLFAPVFFFYDVFFQIFNNISSARVDFEINNIVDFFSILSIYLLPVCIVCFTRDEFLHFYKKYYYLIIVCIFVFFYLFWSYESDVLAGGAIKKILLFIFDQNSFFKFFYISSSFLGLLLTVQLIKDKEFKIIFFVVPYLIFIIFSNYVFQEYLDPLVLIYFMIYTKLLDSLREKQILFLYSYFFLFLVSANIYYTIL